MSSKTKGLPYAVEIPSREQVLETLSEEGVPVSFERLAELLGVQGAEALEGFERRVAAMERDGQVVRNRRGAILIADKAGLVKGKVVGHPDSFGFLRPDVGDEDLFLGPKEMHKVLHGDGLVVVGIVIFAHENGVDYRGIAHSRFQHALVLRNANDADGVFARTFDLHFHAWNLGCADLLCET